jgi:hypothetical protein
MLTWIRKIAVGFCNLAVLERVCVENSTNHAMSLLWISI